MPGSQWRVVNPWVTLMMIAVASMLLAGCVEEVTEVIVITVVPAASVGFPVFLLVTFVLANNKSGGWVALVAQLVILFLFGWPLLILLAGLLWLLKWPLILLFGTIWLILKWLWSVYSELVDAFVSWLNEP